MTSNARLQEEPELRVVGVSLERLDEGFQLAKFFDNFTKRECTSIAVGRLLASLRAEHNHLKSITNDIECGLCLLWQVAPPKAAPYRAPNYGAILRRSQCFWT